MFPDEKDHPRFSEARDVEVQLFPREQQNSTRQRMVRTTFGKAIDDGVIDNTTIGYFMYRTFLFLQSIGIHLYATLGNLGGVEEKLLVASRHEWITWSAAVHGCG